MVGKNNKIRKLEKILYKCHTDRVENINFAFYFLPFLINVLKKRRGSGAATYLNLTYANVPDLPIIFFSVRVSV